MTSEQLKYTAYAGGAAMAVGAVLAFKMYKATQAGQSVTGPERYLATVLLGGGAIALMYGGSYGPHMLKG